MNELQALQCVQFETMSREEQLEALQMDGVYVGKLRLEDGTSLLYQYRSIYVEIVYTQHRNVIKHIHCYADVTVLDQYLLEE